MYVCLVRAQDLSFIHTPQHNGTQNHGGTFTHVWDPKYGRTKSHHIIILLQRQYHVVPYYMSANTECKKLMLDQKVKVISPLEAK